ncbi:hypothetical protein AN958_08519 [Leucoagaricus sp. SymC.cos]|nr:hypothetical protein AN958_08519 [Leucoagaricus sp. SymC.cos]
MREISNVKFNVHSRLCAPLVRRGHRVREDQRSTTTITRLATIEKGVNVNQLSDLEAG